MCIFCRDYRIVWIVVCGRRKGSVGRVVEDATVILVDDVRI